MKPLSRIRLFATPWTAAYQAPPSRGFSRQEYWSGVPLPSPNPWLGLTLKDSDAVSIGGWPKFLKFRVFCFVLFFKKNNTGFLKILLQVTLKAQPRLRTIAVAESMGKIP